MPGVTYGTELFGPLLMREELLTEPLRYADGQLHLPNGPGSAWSSTPPPSRCSMRLSMLFHVRMDVAVPRDLDPAERDSLLAEKARALELQRSGTWVHLWVVGHYSNMQCLTSTRGTSCIRSSGACRSSRS